MKNILLFILMVGGWSSNQPATAQSSSKQLPAARSGNGSFYYPAEFEPHQAIWLGFDSNEFYQPLLTQMIRELTPSVKVNVVIEHDSLLKEGERYFASRGIDTSRIQLVVQSPTDFWYRDPGPVFLKNDQGELRIADFAYSNYQNVPLDSLSEKAIAHGKIDQDIARRMGLATVATSLVTEGGALEVNGKGTLLQVEAVTLGRNKHLSKPAIEKELCRVLGQKKVIWLKEGVADDPLNGSNIADNYFGFGTGGHVDEFCRFADARTILLAWVTDEEAKQNPVHRLTQTRMQANFEILRQATDQDGKPFRIVKFPVPEMEALRYSMDTTSEDGNYFRTFKPSLQQGDTWYYVPAASYLNYVISNRVMLVPAYWEKGKPLSIKKKDEEALALFKRYFPGYKIVPLNPYNLNRGGGGMHCLVQQQPK